jgi:hypothetical protein
MQNSMSGLRAATKPVRARRLDLGGGVTAVILDQGRDALRKKTFGPKAFTAKRFALKRKRRPSH